MNADIVIDKGLAGEAAWLEARRSGVTATDVAKIMGLSGFGSARSVAEEKRQGPKPPSEEEEERFWFGHAAETAIFERLRAILPPALGVERCGTLYRSRRYPWLMASPDGFIVDDGKRSLVEAKGTSMEPWAMPPEDYRVQVHVQAIVGEMEDADNAIYALHRGSQLIRYPIRFDCGLADRIVNETGEWWMKFQHGEQFPAGASDLARVREAIPLVGGTTSVNPMLAQAYVEARAAAQAAKRAQDAAQARLLEALAGAATGTAGSWVVRRQQINMPQSVRAAHTQDRLTVSRMKGE